jgi:methyltransferase family protein
MTVDIESFRSDHYRRHNQRRQEHLATLGLAIAGRSVLEVGAGIGDHTSFFRDRGCAVTATDAREPLLQLLAARHPGVATEVWDMEQAPPAALAPHEVVYAYGILYHTRNPAQVIAHLAKLCTGLLLLETCLSYGAASACPIVDEVAADPTQAVSGRGSRPTRAWVLETLRREFPHAYMSRTQPWHEEFPLDWTRAAAPEGGPLVRGVFVASRTPLDEARLSPRVLDRLERS